MTEMGPRSLTPPLSLAPYLIFQSVLLLNGAHFSQSYNDYSLRQYIDLLKDLLFTPDSNWRSDQGKFLKCRYHVSSLPQTLQDLL